MVGGLVGYNALKTIAFTTPALRPVVLPFIIAYIAFAILTWVSYPLSNLILLTSRFGRLALPRRRKWEGAALGLSIFAALVATAAWLWTDELSLKIAALYLGLFIFPVAATTRARAGVPQVIMIVYALALGALGGVIVAAMWSPSLLTYVAHSPLIYIYPVGCIASLLLANIVNSSSPGAKR